MLNFAISILVDINHIIVTCVCTKGLNGIVMVLCAREKKELKARQAKHSMESVKSVMADKSVKNKAERERSDLYSLTLCCLFTPFYSLMINK